MAQLAKSAKRRCIALVGHEPDLGELAAHLIGARRALPFKKGGICRIDVASLSTKAAGTLVWFVTPKILRKLAVSETVAVIINPISGAGRRPDVARQRAELATAFLHRRGVDGEVFVTERGGHARELALAALGRGVSLCIAWGGDGTINETASALAFSRCVTGDHPEWIRQRVLA